MGGHPGPTDSKRAPRSTRYPYHSARWARSHWGRLAQPCLWRWVTCALDRGSPGSPHNNPRPCSGSGQKSPPALAYRHHTTNFHFTFPSSTTTNCCRTAFFQYILLAPVCVAFIPRQSRLPIVVSSTPDSAPRFIFVAPHGSDLEPTIYFSIS